MRINLWPVPPARAQVSFSIYSELSISRGQLLSSYLQYRLIARLWKGAMGRFLLVPSLANIIT